MTFEPCRPPVRRNDFSAWLEVVVAGELLRLNLEAIRKKKDPDPAQKAAIEAYDKLMKGGKQ